MRSHLRARWLVVVGLVTGCSQPVDEAVQGTTDSGPAASTDSGADDAASDSTPADSTGAATVDATEGGADEVSSGGGDTCSDGACEPIPCPSEGGVYCGGNGVGGDPNVLYVCHDGALEVLEDCGEMCSYMPLGTPDQCPSEIDVPPSLIDLLDVVPYVEQDCEPTTYPGWPYDAQSCNYSTQGVSATVVVADPAPERVGAWIVDAAMYIPALAELNGVDQGAYEQGLAAIGLHMLYQSSRIFPLTGDIIEDLGGGPELFGFDDGVSNPCSSLCYCRINSLHRTEWCAYREALGDSYDECLAAIGDSDHTPEWAGHCLDNHIDAWTSDANEHFRAKAWLANQSVAAACPPATCSPAQVVDAVESAYGL